jgi:DNA primase
MFDLVSIARAHVPGLTQAGSTFVGRCPAHPDADEPPTLVIDTALESFHCSACGAAGDVGTFVRLLDAKATR